jgi:hypothetical protein
VTALLVVETIILVLLVLLVAGLLRSHAEILRRLNALDRAGGTAPSAPADGRWASEGSAHPDWLPKPRSEAAPAVDISGRTLRGDAVHVGIRGSTTSTLLAFLSSGCATCGQFWRAFREEPPLMPADARLVIVTKDSSQESPSKLRELAPRDATLVMSTTAWDDYRVPMSPYFLLVEGGSGEILGEGSAGNWPQVESLLRDALADAEIAVESGAAVASDEHAANGGDGGSRATGGTAARLARMDAELAAAGIGPGHPSLYLGEDPDREPDRG